ncbi:ribosomal protein S18 acetylase RimI-like enzyme [Parabacteroides sp. PF5-5]|uniref:GNAT family N-acetyltransferase n=1 Tax=unclassified Parabacteroides TaxID=2649774 RepID=UPI0024738676|nr:MULTISPECIES: GNAT family N-acetyltransferase [unclassified Parabacteroides]MDH6303675.1 ribosomal protein S18 acetylase RimI-like enzyme [Parabacteroides sp. PH5-39]MDH6314292.1 ribosomal protein S18 acetylase RimI-like enzyme [Parabacteroides sp. PF5-13]MDH6318644.1 ribosomal protein S18 acetylase RimI-like enzyme [Parabacteroides sp. PH5-13]MDH6322064.1 ribosomal protein S18 acetylase RimI-like enzyme [Parabacteroides sp. PH5-8]MDH6325857.1 ribosomal protein S18 acetylase RimI-like enzym
MEQLRIQHDTAGVDWKTVADTLRDVRMGYYAPDKHNRAFDNSYAVIFVFDGAVMVGFGRILSDGEYQSAIYDVAVNPDYQGRGIGKMIVCELMNTTPGCNFILYSSPGKECFYEKLGFRKMKTGMAAYLSSETMQKKGFT